MNLTIVGPRVAIKPEALPEITSDGLLHLVHEGQNSTMLGTVVALGDGPQFTRDAAHAAFDSVIDLVMEEGLRSLGGKISALKDRYRGRQHIVEIGDRVLFSPNTGEELVFEKDLLIVMAEDQVLAVIE